MASQGGFSVRSKGGKAITIRLQMEDYKAFAKIADKDYRTVSGQAMLIILEWLKNQGEPNERESPQP